MLLFGAMAQLTQRKKPLQIAIRLFVYFFVPLTAAIVGVLLIGDGVVMLRREGRGIGSFLPILMGGGMLAGMTLAVLAARHIIHPGRILRVALGVVVMMTSMSAQRLALLFFCGFVRPCSATGKV